MRKKEEEKSGLVESGYKYVGVMEGEKQIHTHNSSLSPAFMRLGILLPDMQPRLSIFFLLHPTIHLEDKGH